MERRGARNVSSVLRFGFFFRPRRGLNGAGFLISDVRPPSSLGWGVKLPSAPHAQLSLAFRSKLGLSSRLPHRGLIGHPNKEEIRDMSQNTQVISAAAAGTVQLGDCTVNRLGYGATRITGKGMWGPPADRDAALATLRRAVELEVDFIDTADSYGPYVSEELIAEALWPYLPGLVIATKGGWNRVGPGQWTHDATPKHLEEAVEGSLKSLHR